MLNYIDKLRKKSEPERRRAVLFISLGITLCIAILWGISFGFKLSSSDVIFNTDKVKQDSPSLTDTFSSFFEELNRSLHSVESATDTSTTTP